MKLLQKIIIILSVITIAMVTFYGVALFTPPHTRLTQEFSSLLGEMKEQYHYNDQDTLAIKYFTYTSVLADEKMTAITPIDSCKKNSRQCTGWIDGTIVMSDLYSTHQGAGDSKVWYTKLDPNTTMCYYNIGNTKKSNQEVQQTIENTKKLPHVYDTVCVDSRNKLVGIATLRL